MAEKRHLCRDGREAESTGIKKLGQMYNAYTEKRSSYSLAEVKGMGQEVIYKVCLTYTFSNSIYFFFSS